MIDHAVERIRNYVRGIVEGVDPDRMEVTIKLDPMSPWILIKLAPAVASYQARDLDFAVWKASGRVHKVVDGEVQDPELFSLGSRV
jgi:hypothetical protein